MKKCLPYLGSDDYFRFVKDLLNIYPAKGPTMIALLLIALAWCVLATLASFRKPAGTEHDTEQGPGDPNRASWSGSG